MILLTQQVDWGFWVIFLCGMAMGTVVGWLLKVAWDEAQDAIEREEARRLHPSSQPRTGEPRVGQWTERWEEDDHDT